MTTLPLTILPDLSVVAGDLVGARPHDALDIATQYSRLGSMLPVVNPVENSLQAKAA